MTHEFLYQNYFTRNIITLDDGSGCYVRVRGCTGQKWRGGDIQLTVFLADWQHKAWFNSQRNVCSGVASPLCIHINAPYACYQEQFRTASECFSCHWLAMTGTSWQLALSRGVARTTTSNPDIFVRFPFLWPCERPGSVCSVSRTIARLQLERLKSCPKKFFFSKKFSYIMRTQYTFTSLKTTCEFRWNLVWRKGGGGVLHSAVKTETARTSKMLICLYPTKRYIP